jgi:putative transposase
VVDWFTRRVLAWKLSITMDGKPGPPSYELCAMGWKGRWRDNVFVERVWKSIKYEEVYLHAYESVQQAREFIGRYLEFYNSVRPHSSLGAFTPDQVYFNHLPESMAASKQELPLKEKAKTVRTTGTTSKRTTRKSRSGTC